VGACLADFLACLPCLLAFLPCLPTLAFPLSVILSLTQVTSLATHPTGIPRPAAATGSEDGGIKVWTLGPMENASDGLAGGGFGGLGGDDDEGGAGNDAADNGRALVKAGHPGKAKGGAAAAAAAGKGGKGGKVAVSWRCSASLEYGAGAVDALAFSADGERLPRSPHPTSHKMIIYTSALVRVLIVTAATHRNARAHVTARWKGEGSV